MNELIKAINELKKEKNAIILGHYYQKGEIQDIADYVGDSLALAQWAAKTEADIIVMCGVHFMGETAKVLCPDKKVLVPDMAAGCSLFVGGQLSGGSVCTVCQRTPGIHRYFVRQHNSCRESSDRCGGDFHQCEADRGKLPKR